MNQTPSRPAGAILVDQLVAQKIERAFCVPGESYLPVLDAFHARNDIELISCRHEGGACMMAEAHGKLSGRPGVCLVTRGPGATNASIGVHIARQDGTPLLLLIGQVGSAHRDREAFQEVDLVAMFRPLAKWAAQIDRASRIPEYLHRGVGLACSGRPGPVVLVLPEDMLRDSAAVPDAGFAAIAPAAPDPADLGPLSRRLATARSPLIVVGPAASIGPARSRLQAWAPENGFAVATGFRCQDGFDNLNPAYVGHLGLGMDPRLANFVKSADLLMLIGQRSDEITTDAYKLMSEPAEGQYRVHVYPDGSELANAGRPDLALPVDPSLFLAWLCDQSPDGPAARRAAMAGGHRDYLEFSTPVAGGDAREAPLDPAWIFTRLQAELPADAIVTNGAGNYAIWLHRYFRYREPGTQLAPRAGAMGYGLPAALAAKARHPDRTVVCVAGDGCLMMSAQELATAIRHRLAVKILVFNNGAYGTIRMHQERNYPGRPVATDLSNPDFVAWARAFGARAERIERLSDFERELPAALRHDGPALLEIITDPDRLSPGARLLPGGGLGAVT